MVTVPGDLLWQIGRKNNIFMVMVVGLGFDACHHQLLLLRRYYTYDDIHALLSILSIVSHK
jgi:hypothetical protein